MREKYLHVTDAELLLHADGEMATDSSSRIRVHLGDEGGLAPGVPPGQEVGVVVGGVDENGDPGIPGHVPGALALWLGVHQDVLPVGVHPGEQRLRLTAWHQGDHRGQVLAVGQANGVLVECHHNPLSRLR